MDSAAASGFGQCASSYARARPGFPATAVEWIAKSVPLRTDHEILELGAGAGALTKLLLEQGMSVIALEPVPAMREELVRDAPRACVVAGVAEAIPIRAGSMSVVIAANALHWFDLQRALPETHRVLRADGSLVLLWSLRDQVDPTQAALEQIARTVTGGSGQRYSGLNWEQVLADSPLFRERSRQVFPFRQELAEADVVSLAASWSAVGAMNAPDREGVLARVAELVRDRGRVTLDYRVEVQVYDPLNRSA